VSINWARLAIWLLHRYFSWFNNTLLTCCHGNHEGGSIFSFVSLYCSAKQRFHSQLKEHKIFYLRCIISICEMLCEIDGCLKCTFAIWLHWKTKRIPKYKQILPTMLTLLYNNEKSGQFCFFILRLLSLKGRTSKYNDTNTPAAVSYRIYAGYF
jgi:hypothetical protein